MQLTDLVGTHMLSGVDRLYEKVESYSRYDPDSGEVFRFELDGVTYGAHEDPSDGYRSMMSHLSTYEDRPANIFEPVQVEAVMRDCKRERYYGGCEILDLVYNGEVILSVGTDDYDDYYPYFVARWDPTPLGMVDTTGE